MTTTELGSAVRIEAVDASAFEIPTEEPEADGTLAWKSTTLVLVEVKGGDETGIGYTYAHPAATELVWDPLSRVVREARATDVRHLKERMLRVVRNVGRPGLASMAISAVEVALWDLAGKLLDLSVAELLGGGRRSVPVYGSGGFTTLSGEPLADRCRAWQARGVPAVKIKIGVDPAEDLRRVETAREALGPETELYVDANGAYERKEALAMADRLAERGVWWFEEPVSSDDLEGLRLIRDRAPAGMEITAGEYGHDAAYFRRMLGAGAVDVLMPDATRCGGLTGALDAAALGRAFGIPVSTHCAPALHLHACAAIPEARPMESFYDHARIEGMLFEGAPEPVDGELSVDPSRPGLGLTFRWLDAEPFRV